MADKKLKFVLELQDKTQKTLSKFDERLDKTEKSLGSLGSTAKMVKGYIAAMVTKETIGALVGLTEQAAKSEEAMMGFARNFGDAEENLQKLRKASKGTINDIDLMYTANRAALLGVTTDIEQLSTLMEVARIRGKEMGVDTTQAFNDIVTGIGRGSPLILDNLGIRIPDALKATMEGMGETEKRQAILNYVIEDGSKILQQYGGDVVTTSDRIKQLKVRFQNFKLAVGEKLVKALEKLMSIFGKMKGGVGGLNKVIEFAKRVWLSFVDRIKFVMERLKNDGKIAEWGEKIKEIMEKLKPIIARFSVAMEIVVEKMGQWYINIIQPLVTYLANQMIPVIETLVDVILWLVENALIPAIDVTVKIIEVIVKVASAIIDVMIPAIRTVAKIVIDAWNNYIQPAFQALWDFVQNVVVPVFQLLRAVVASVFGAITTIIKGAVDWLWNNAIQPMVGWVDQYIAPKFEALVGIMAGIWERIKLGARTGWESIWGAIKDVLNKMIDGINNYFIKSINSVIRNVNKVAGELGTPQIALMPTINRIGEEQSSQGYNPRGTFGGFISQVRADLKNVWGKANQYRSNSGQIIINNNYNQTSADPNAIANEMAFALKWLR